MKETKKGKKINIFSKKHKQSKIRDSVPPLAQDTHTGTIGFVANKIVGYNSVSFIKTKDSPGSSLDTLPLRKTNNQHHTHHV